MNLPNRLLCVKEMSEYIEHWCSLAFYAVNMSQSRCLTLSYRYEWFAHFQKIQGLDYSVGLD